MSELVTLNLSDARETSRNLVLSTWFINFFHQEKRWGGLPNDFITRAPGALLIYDEVLCDEEALEAETTAAKRGRWITSELFVELRRARRLRTVSFRELIPSSFWSRPDIKQLQSQALETMGEALSLLKRPGKRNKGAVGDRIKTLASINAYLFRSGPALEGLKYNWQANLLKESGSSPFRHVSSQESGLSVHSVVKKVLRLGALDVQLVPDLTKQGSAALEAVKRRERKLILRYMFGDRGLTHQHLEDIRYSDEFRDLDAIVDDPKRRKEAFRNLEKILRIHSDTKRVRASVQMAIADVLSGKKRPSDVEEEIRMQLLEIAKRAPSVKSLAPPAWGIAGPVAEVGLEFAKEGVRAAVAPIIGAVDFVRGVKEIRERRDLVDAYPLGHFFAIASKTNEKHQTGPRLRLDTMASKRGG